MNRLRIIGRLMAGMCLLTGCSHTQSTPAPSPRDPGRSAASTPATAASRNTAQKAAPFSGACVKTDKIDLKRVDTAPKVQWIKDGKTGIPLTSQGPFEVSGDDQRCFSPSLAGAAAAASNFLAREAATSDTMTSVYTHNAQPAQTPAEIATAKRGPWVQVMGFNFAQVSDDGKHVTVHLHIACPDPRDRSRVVGLTDPVAVVWVGNDWKLDMPAYEKTTPVLNSNEDFTPWHQ